jgi:hypothetical protein
MDAEKIAGELAERVRELITDAQKRAEEIVRGAEAEARQLREEAGGEAQRIREEAEAQARERLDQVRQALEQLEAGLGAKRGMRRSKPEPPQEPEVPEAPEAEPAMAEQEPAAAEPQAPAAAEQAPSELSTDQLIEQLKAGGEPVAPEPEPVAQASNDTPEDDAGAARLVAMKLALDGTSRDEARKQLDADYEVADLDSLLDEVYSMAGK